MTKKLNVLFDNQSTQLIQLYWGLQRSRGAPYNGLYGEAPPKRNSFFRLQVYKRVGISLVEVCKRVGKSVINCNNSLIKFLFLYSCFSLKKWDKMIARKPASDSMKY